MSRIMTQTLQKTRVSNFEILRLVAMFIIITHHFVVHGIYPVIPISSVHTFNAAAAVLIGWGGYFIMVPEIWTRALDFKRVLSVYIWHN